MFNIKITFEKWRFNKEYGVYVSNQGNLKDSKKKNISPNINESGYFAIKTNKGTISIHKLVMITWVGPKKENMTIDHINSNKRDNRVKNLEYVSNEENKLRASNKLLNFEDDGSEIIQVLRANKIHSIPQLIRVLSASSVKNVIASRRDLNRICAKTANEWAKLYLKYYPTDKTIDLNMLAFRVKVFAEKEKVYCGYRLSQTAEGIEGVRVC